MALLSTMPATLNARVGPKERAITLGSAAASFIPSVSAGTPASKPQLSQGCTNQIKLLSDGVKCPGWLGMLRAVQVLAVFVLAA